jgi:hypothetical protein
LRWSVISGFKICHGTFKMKGLIMSDITRVRLDAFGGLPAGGGGILDTTGTVDLGVRTGFAAWGVFNYIGGRGSGPWDFDNAFALEIFSVDGVVAPIDALNGRFGPAGAFTNLHTNFLRGFGRFITFRFRIFQPEEMEAQASGVVMFGL